MEEFWHTGFYSVASVPWGLYAFILSWAICLGQVDATTSSVKQSEGMTIRWQFKSGLCLKVQKQHHSQGEVWTGSSQRLHFLLFQSFCCRFAGVLGFFVLLCDTVLARLQLSGRCPHIWLSIWSTEELVLSKVCWSYGCKTSPNDYSATIVLHSWYAVLVHIFECISMLMWLIQMTFIQKSCSTANLSSDVMLISEKRSFHLAVLKNKPYLHRLLWLT